jgi:hypothetical protein
MDSLDRRLVELNEALLKIKSGEKPTEEMMNRAMKILSRFKKRLFTLSLTGLHL